MGNKKSRQDLLGYDLSSDTEDEEEEEEEKEDEIFVKSEMVSPEMLQMSPEMLQMSPELLLTSSPDVMTSSQQYADNLRMFETSRSKDPDVEPLPDVLDLSG